MSKPPRSRMAFPCWGGGAPGDGGCGRGGGGSYISRGSGHCDDFHAAGVGPRASVVGAGHSHEVDPVAICGKGVRSGGTRDPSSYVSSVVSTPRGAVVGGILDFIAVDGTGSGMIEDSGDRCIRPFKSCQARRARRIEKSGKTHIRQTAIV